MAAEIAKSCTPVYNSRSGADGIPYAVRKHQSVRSKKGRIKREMFAKLRTNRFMKAKGSGSASVVELTSKVQRMARVHQYGLKGRPGRNSATVKYPERKLFGFSGDELKLIEGEVIKF